MHFYFTVGKNAKTSMAVKLTSVVKNGDDFDDKRDVKATLGLEQVDK